jgi:magnesium transporter
MMPYWSNLLDHLQKIWERLEDNKELIAGIASSNESILSNRSNELVKFLTVITSISFPFVIVNNLYSMNVKGLPFADQSWIVYILFLVIFVGGFSIISYFKYKDWL